MNPSIRIMFAATALVAAPPLLAHGVTAGALAIGHPWSRETAPGQKAGGGFLTITNKGKTEDRLLSATSPAAADVQMPGVSKWELAAYARSMPGRGGVGTYCYTKSVHVDIGPERDWNWRCRRKRHRR